MPRLRAFIRASWFQPCRHWAVPLALKPAPMRPEGHGQEGTWTHPFATWGQPSTLKVPTKAPEGCILRRKPYGHEGRSIPANDEPAHPFAGCPRACALMDSAISSEGFRDPRAGCCRRGLRHRHRRGEPYQGTRRHAQSARRGSKRARTDSSVQGESGTRLTWTRSRRPRSLPFVSPERDLLGRWALAHRVLGLGPACPSPGCILFEWRTSSRTARGDGPSSCRWTSPTLVSSSRESSWRSMRRPTFTNIS